MIRMCDIGALFRSKSNESKETLKETTSKTTKIQAADDDWSDLDLPSIEDPEFKDIQLRGEQIRLRLEAFEKLAPPANWMPGHSLIRDLVHLSVNRETNDFLISRESLLRHAFALSEGNVIRIPPIWLSSRKPNRDEITEIREALVLLTCASKPQNGESLSDILLLKLRRGNDLRSLESLLIHEELERILKAFEFAYERYCDLGLCWAFLAASSGSRFAMHEMAIGIERVLDSMPVETRGLAEKLPDAWRRLSEGTVGVSPNINFDYGFRKAVRNNSFDLLKLDDPKGGGMWFVFPPIEKTSDTQSLPKGSEVIVLSKIEKDSTHRVNKDLQSQFGHLLLPVPRVGKADPDAIYAILSGEFPWMDEANLAVAEASALCASGKRDYVVLDRPLLLVGEPGIGKSRWAGRVAEACGIPLSVISLSGAKSAKIVAGSERGWASARPSAMALALAEHGVANPLLLIDEVDKVSSGDYNGDPVAALLPAMERETARRYRDSYLLGDLDLSHVSWILTANKAGGLPSPLLDRVRLVQAKRPSIYDLPGIVQGILDEVGQERGLSAELLASVSHDDKDVVAAFESSRSVRITKEAVLTSLMRKIWMPPALRARAALRLVES